MRNWPGTPVFFFGGGQKPVGRSFRPPLQRLKRHTEIQGDRLITQAARALGVVPWAYGLGLVSFMVLLSVGRARVLNSIGALSPQGHYASIRSAFGLIW